MRRSCHLELSDVPAHRHPAATRRVAGATKRPEEFTVASPLRGTRLRGWVGLGRMPDTVVPGGRAAKPRIDRLAVLPESALYVRCEAPSTEDISSGRRGGLRSHGGPGGRTRDQLYDEARAKNIRGRSKMSKADLERAVGR